MSDPDVNLFNESNLPNLDRAYLDIEEAKSKLFSLNDSNSFDKFKTSLAECSHNFSLTEAWCTDESFKNNTNFHMPNYKSNNKKGAGICIYVLDTL